MITSHVITHNAHEVTLLLASIDDTSFNK